MVPLLYREFQSDILHFTRFCLQLSSPYGNYMQVATIGKKGDKAVLNSPAFPYNQNGYCLTWFYLLQGIRMRIFFLGGGILFKLYLKKGNNTGSLSVILKNQKLLTLSGDVGAEWNMTGLKIPEQATLDGFTISFEGNPTTYMVLAIKSELKKNLFQPKLEATPKA